MVRLAGVEPVHIGKVGVFTGFFSHVKGLKGCFVAYFLA